MKRNALWRASLPFIFLILGNCYTTPMPKATAQDASALGISVTLRLRYNLFGLLRKSPNKVYFIREEGEGNLVSDEVIASNFVAGDRIYLLNARPGRYYAIAAFYETTHDYVRPKPKQGNAVVESVPPDVAKTTPEPKETPSADDTGLVPAEAPGATDTGLVPPGPESKKGIDSQQAVARPVARGVTILFPEDVARKTLVIVSPGHLYYMGGYILDLHDLEGRLDSFQMHYLKILLPDYSVDAYLKNLFSRDTVYTASLRVVDRSIEAIREFGREARDDLKHSSWVGILHL